MDSHITCLTTLSDFMSVSQAWECTWKKPEVQ